MKDGAPWIPRHSLSERCTTTAGAFYDFEVECRRQGWGDPAFVYDEEFDLFRFHDGRFAFSREHTDWELLRKRGRMKGWEYGATPGPSDLPLLDHAPALGEALAHLLDGPRVRLQSRPLRTGLHLLYTADDRCQDDRG